MWKAHDCNVLTENMAEMMMHKNRFIQEGIISKQIWGRNNKKLVLKAEITGIITGITRTITIQEEVVATATKSDLRRQSQTVVTAFQQSVLFNTFGPYADKEKNYHH